MAILSTQTFRQDFNRNPLLIEYDIPNQIFQKIA